MRYKKIPNTDLEVSVISLGTWVFGGDNWGNVNEKDCIEAVSATIDCGINLIDTAPIYGYGKSEKIVGKAIKDKRDKIIIATKCGLSGKGVNITNNLKPDSIKKEAEESLSRLGIDYIDIYQCHWPDKNTPIEDTMRAMSGLKKEGKIRYIGVSNFDSGLLKEALNFADITTLQNHFSLLERGIEKDILPLCREKGVAVLAYGSLGGGILSGKYKKPTGFKGSDARNFFYKYYKGEAFEETGRLIDAMNEISIKINRPLSQVALNWICQKDGVVSAIVGCRNQEQARINALAATWQLSKEDINMLNSL